MQFLTFNDFAPILQRLKQHKKYLEQTGGIAFDFGKPFKENSAE